MILSKSTKVSIIALIFVVLQIYGARLLSLLHLYDSETIARTNIFYYLIIFIIPLIIILAVSRDDLKETLSLRNPGIKNILMALVITVFLFPLITFLSFTIIIANYTMPFKKKCPT